MLDCVRRDYPSRRDARIAEDDLGDFYEVRQVYINRLELEGWDDNGQEVPLSPWDVQRVREAIREHASTKVRNLILSSQLAFLALSAALVLALEHLSLA